MNKTPRAEPPLAARTFAPEELVVMTRALPAQDALAQIAWFREETGFLHCGYEESRWAGVWQALALQKERSGLLVHDAVLAETLRAQGVTRFYTRNVADFRLFVPHGLVLAS
jgi:predicted nucleic acid-binding protein